MRSLYTIASLILALLFTAGCNDYSELSGEELYHLAEQAAHLGKMDKAEELARSAFKKGDIRAQVLLGSVLYDRDRDAAFRHWNMAAEKGEPGAKYNLGFFAYADQNDQEAAIWISDAASQGHEQAQYLYAMMYQEGRGVEMNFDKARYWLQKAADQNNSYAIEQLKLMDGDVY